MKYLLTALIALTFISCQNIFPKKDPPKVSTGILDTIKTSPAGIVSTPALFETAFIKGTTEKIDKSTISLYGVTIGKLKVTSGRIVACDPLHMDEYGIPYTQLFPTGEFPVQLSIGKLDSDESIVFARINFSDEPVVKWEFALLEGQEPLPFGGKKMYGYSVDASTGIFIDEEAMKAMDPTAVTEAGALFKEMDKHYRNFWRYTMYNFDKYNAAAFTTGLGDGRYATYIGFDASGKPCRLLTDFGFFNWKQKQ